MPSDADPADGHYISHEATGEQSRCCAILCFAAYCISAGMFPALLLLLFLVFPAVERNPPPSLHLRPLQTSRTFPLLVSAVFPLHHQRRRSTNTGTVSAAAPVSALILWFAAQIKDCGRNLGSRFQEQHKLTAKHQACSLTVLMLHVGHFLGRFQYFLNILYFWLYERINKKLFLNYSYFALYILDSSYFAQQLLHNSFLQDR